MGSFQDYGRRDPSIVGLLPARDAEAPPIATLEAGKVKLWGRGGEVVAALLGEGKKLLGHHCAHRVATEIARSGLTKSITIESCHRITPALL